MNTHKWTGKDVDFVVEWSPMNQLYKVIYKGKLFALKYRFRDVKQYLD